MQPKDPHGLAQSRLAECVADIQAILWKEGDTWDSFKPWDQATTLRIAIVLSQYGLAVGDYSALDGFDDAAMERAATTFHSFRSESRKAAAIALPTVPNETKPCDQDDIPTMRGG